MRFHKNSLIIGNKMKNNKIHLCDYGCQQEGEVCLIDTSDGG